MILHRYNSATDSYFTCIINNYTYMSQQQTVGLKRKYHTVLTVGFRFTLVTFINTNILVIKYVVTAVNTVTAGFSYKQQTTQPGPTYSTAEMVNGRNGSSGSPLNCQTLQPGPTYSTAEMVNGRNGSSGSPLNCQTLQPGPTYSTAEMVNGRSCHCPTRTESH